MNKQFLALISVFLLWGLSASAALAENNFVPARSKSRMIEARPNTSDPTLQKNMVQELITSLPAPEPMDLIEK